MRSQSQTYTTYLQKIKNEKSFEIPTMKKDIMRKHLLEEINTVFTSIWWKIQTLLFCKKSSIWRKFDKLAFKIMDFKDYLEMFPLEYTILSRKVSLNSYMYFFEWKIYKCLLTTTYFPLAEKSSFLLTSCLENFGILHTFAIVRWIIRLGIGSLPLSGL